MQECKSAANWGSHADCLATLWGPAYKGLCASVWRSQFRFPPPRGAREGTVAAGTNRTGLEGRRCIPGGTTGEGRFGKLHCVCDNSEGVCTAAGPAELGGLNSPDPLETEWTRAVRLRPSVSGAEMHPSLATWSHPAARPWLERLRVGGGWGGERNCSQVHAVP